MTGTVHSGPIITAGNTMDALQNSAQLTNPSAGPNIEYHGNSFLDVRYLPLNKESIGNLGVIPAVLANPSPIALNVVPVTAGASGNVATAQGVTSGVAMTLASAAAAGISTNVPMLAGAVSFTVPDTIVNTAVVMDFGIEAVTTVSGNKTITVGSSATYRIGQPVVIANAGNSAGTVALLTYVTALPSTTTITLADAPLVSSSTVRIGSGLPGWNNLSGAPVQRPTFASPNISGGVGLFFDATQAISRGVAITGVASGTGGIFTVAGLDIYGNVQTQAITVAAGANTVKSTKTWKAITSVTSNFTDTSHNYSVNTIDLFGFPFRNDFWETLSIYYAGALITSSTGWVKGDLTSPATTATGDPRGTYALQSASNSSNRLFIIQQLPFLNLVRSNPTAPQFLYGTTPV